MKHIILILAVFLSFINCDEVLAKLKNHPKKPNILFVLLDDLGKEWLSCYGATGITTPNIDKLAQTGLKFTNVYSMPQCTPSRVTLLTGQYPNHNGWVNHYDVPRWGHGAQFDPEMNPSFAKMMKSAGYATCIAGKWQLNDFRLQPNILCRVGFDAYCMWTGGEGGNIEASQKRYWDPYIHSKEGSKTYTGQFGDDIFSDFIIDFMEKNKDKPMMIYYPMCLPHLPLTTTPLEPNAPLGEQHKAMVRYADFLLGKLLKALDDLKIRDNTIVVWTTDNGTTSNFIGERNGMKVRGGKTYLTENGVNAPFIVNCPGLVPEGRITSALADFTDMLPTFCELGGATLDNQYIYDGYSLARLFLGETDAGPRTCIISLGSHPAKIENGRVENTFAFRDRVIRDKNYKAYVDTLHKIYEIIDLDHDFYEQNNLINSPSNQVKSALSKFKDQLNKIPMKDSQPRYQKLDSSYYDIPAMELEKQYLKGKKMSNKAPLP